MRKVHLSLIGLAMIALVGCKDESKKAEVDEEVVVKEAETVVEASKQAINNLNVAMESKSGSQAKGQAAFRVEDGKVIFEAKFSGLSPGPHAIHIHEKADCSSPDGKSSGGHWNPTFEDHGKWGATAGYHKGDIGNFIVDAEGNGRITFSTDEWCLGCGDDKKDVMGKAIIVHEGTDDFTSQPSGDAGARISCGGIIK